MKRITRKERAISSFVEFLNNSISNCNHSTSSTVVFDFEKWKYYSPNHTSYRDIKYVLEYVENLDFITIKTCLNFKKHHERDNTVTVDLCGFRKEKLRNVLKNMGL